MKITIRFAWYDLWIGAYWDRTEQCLYLCPLPTVAVRVDGIVAARQAVGRRISCWFGTHDYKLLDPARDAWQYNVWVCARGCPGYWARERFDMEIRFFKISPLNWRTHVHGITD